MQIVLSHDNRIIESNGQQPPVSYDVRQSELSIKFIHPIMAY